jgi:hypothetical protein
VHLLLLLLLWPQDYTQRGFVEAGAVLYPQEASNDAAKVVGEARIRYEGFYRFHDNWQLAGGVDLRTDSHHQTEREFRLDWRDRERLRPLASLRRLSLQFHKGGLTLEAGRQFIRWGRTDILNPTDRFAPRDYMTVVDNEFLGIEAVRATYGRGANTIEAVWTPRMTPSRTPLITQRWFVAPPGAPEEFAVERHFPKGAQAGVRWNHTGFVEFSAAYFSGFSHAPSYGLVPGKLAIRRTHAEQRMVGGDVAVPLLWLTLKGEVAYTASPGGMNDETVLYVVQFERQSGEWFFIGGYGGEVLTEKGFQLANFNPDRGMTRTILARAGYTIDVNRSVALESAVRQNGDGVWLKSEYTQAFGQHWRLTTSASLIRGKPGDFLGQYRLNSHGAISMKYSF